MKFGFRIPSINKRIAATTSVKRIVRHTLGFKAPRGMGWITDTKKAMYNKLNNKTSRGSLVSVVFLLRMPLALAYVVYNLFSMMLRYFLIAFIFTLLAACGNSNDSRPDKKPVYVKPSIDYKGKFRKGYVRMPVSTKKNAIKNQNSSRYYYNTRGKYRRKK